MEFSSLVFALILFSAGVWLIFMISGDFKGKNKQAQHVPTPARRNPPRSPHVANTPARAHAFNSPRQVQTPKPAGAVNSSLVVVEQATAGAADPLQSLSVGLIRETFERFTREP